MQRGILPKDATLPGVEKMDYDEEKIKEQAKRRVDKKAQSYSNPLVLSLFYEFRKTIHRSKTMPKKI